MDFALKLIKLKSGEFIPMKFKDLYQEGLKEIIEAKMEICAPRGKGEKMPPRKVINIMEALCKSVEQSKGSKTSEPKAIKIALKNLLRKNPLLENRSRKSR
ncbi:MAG: hypothetical protein NMNS01_26990 [Nitrosomonas sp.]|jgi:DNA end-binding protein Ku|nr:MAG: hypothetical protein NMNS01_26990 [Nitrosomonas sp.]